MTWASFSALLSASTYVARCVCELGVSSRGRQSLPHLLALFTTQHALSSQNPVPVRGEMHFLMSCYCLKASGLGVLVSCLCARGRSAMKDFEVAMFSDAGNN